MLIMDKVLNHLIRIQIDFVIQEFNYLIFCVARGPNVGHVFLVLEVSGSHTTYYTR
jgi:hypothetical protein